MALIQDRIKDLVTPTIESLGFEVWGVEYLNGKTPILRIYIDHEDGIDIEDCSDVSLAVSALLDVENPIESEYNLEVSSPGADRFIFTLDQYARYLDSFVTISLRLPQENRRKWIGKLVEVTPNSIKIDASQTPAIPGKKGQKKAPAKAKAPTEPQVVEFLFTNIMRGQLFPEF